MEAMCGFRRVITTLDDRQLVIQSHLGEVVPHGKWLSYTRSLTACESSSVSVSELTGRFGAN